MRSFGTKLIKNHFHTDMGFDGSFSDTFARKDLVIKISLFFKVSVMDFPYNKKKNKKE